MSRNNNLDADDKKRFNRLLKIKRTSYKIFHAFLSILSSILMLTMWIFGVGAVLHQFMDITNDTSYLAGAGFAVLGGLSTISFSWARSLGQEDKRYNQILMAGERALYSAIIFLVASAIKFSAIKWDFDKLLFLFIPLDRIFQLLTGLVGEVAFGFALVLALSSVEQLNSILLRGIWNRWEVKLSSIEAAASKRLNLDDTQESGKNIDVVSETKEQK